MGCGESKEKKTGGSRDAHSSPEASPNSPTKRGPATSRRRQLPAAEVEKMVLTFAYIFRDFHRHYNDYYQTKHASALPSEDLQSGFVLPSIQACLGTAEEVIRHRLICTSQEARGIVQDGAKRYGDKQFLSYVNLFISSEDFGSPIDKGRNAERRIDEITFRLLTLWLDTSQVDQEGVRYEDASSILAEIGVFPGFFIAGRERRSSTRNLLEHVHRTTTGNAAPQKDKPVSFARILSEIKEWCYRPQVSELFFELSGGHYIMSPHALHTFLFEVQGHRTYSTLSTVEEFLASKFGGVLSEPKFVHYFSDTRTNNCLDPKRVMRVCQDMTQPLTSYYIHCGTRCSTLSLLRSALLNGCRMLELKLVPGKSGNPLVETAIDEEGTIGKPLDLLSVFEAIRDCSFQRSTFPLILHLDVAGLPKTAQADAAEVIKTTIGEMLPHGLMFEGGTISDPRFTPAALEHKILIMCDQLEVVPFVGLSVCDMHRQGIGVKVVGVQSDSPAGKAGILNDDWITHINGAPVKDKDDLKAKLKELAIGQEIRLTRENVTEVRVVVGGALNTHDRTHPRASSGMSQLVFLPTHEARSPSLSPMYHKDGQRPWDVREDSAGSFALNDDRMNQDLLELTSRQLSHMHCADGESAVRMWNAGCQMVSINSTRDSERYNEGRFVENSHCGYVLKPSSPTTEAYPATPLASRILSFGNHKISIMLLGNQLYGCFRFTVVEAVAWTLPTEGNVKRIVVDPDAKTSTFETEAHGSAENAFVVFNVLAKMHNRSKQKMDAERKQQRRAAADTPNGKVNGAASGSEQGSPELSPSPAREPLDSDSEEDDEEKNGRLPRSENSGCIQLFELEGVLPLHILRGGWRAISLTSRGNFSSDGKRKEKKMTKVVTEMQQAQVYESQLVATCVAKTTVVDI